MKFPIMKNAETNESVAIIQNFDGEIYNEKTLVKMLCQGA